MLSTAVRSAWWLLTSKVVEKTTEALLVVPRAELGTHMTSYKALTGAQARRRPLCKWGVSSAQLCLA